MEYIAIILARFDIYLYPSLPGMICLLACWSNFFLKLIFAFQFMLAKPFTWEMFPPHHHKSEPPQKKLRTRCNENLLNYVSSLAFISALDEAFIKPVVDEDIKYFISSLGWYFCQVRKKERSGWKLRTLEQSNNTRKIVISPSQLT